MGGGEGSAARNAGTRCRRRFSPRRCFGDVSADGPLLANEDGRPADAKRASRRLREERKRRLAHKGAPVEADKGGNPHGFRRKNHRYHRTTAAAPLATSCSLIALPKSAVVAVPPRSAVGAEASATPIARVSASACSARASPCSSRRAGD